MLSLVSGSVDLFQTSVGSFTVDVPFAGDTRTGLAGFKFAEGFPSDLKLKL